MRIVDEPVPDYKLSRLIYNVILISSILWILLILAAPFLKSLGGSFEDSSFLIYNFFSTVCHQDESRSFHFFENIFGVCSRCTAIYVGFFIGTCVYPFKFKLNNTIPPSVYFLVGAIIVLLADTVMDIFGIRTNTFISRSITGGLIGLVLPFYIIPGFVKFFFEVNSFLRNKVSA